MNLKLKRSTRTPHSEEITIYDLDTRDADDQPVGIGKLDVHYIEDQLVGTLLIWQEFATGYRQSQGSGTGETLDTLIDAILSEVSEPVGVPATYAVEVYYPSFSGQGFVSNYPDDGSEDAGAPLDARANAMGTEVLEEDQYTADAEEVEDEFARRLRQRP